METSGETLPITTKSEQYINDAMQEIRMMPSHQAADMTSDKTKFWAICNSNPLLCNEVDFQWTYTAKEKYLYLASIFKVGNFINDSLTTQQKLEDSLHTIAVNKDTGARRWYATHTTVLLNLGSLANQQEFLELISHELGHILDLWVLEGTDTTKNKTYTEFGQAVFGMNDVSLGFYAISRDNETIRKAESSKKDFCSWYGMSDPFEDFAECFNMYTHHNAMFKQIARNNSTLKKKYNLIAGLFDGQYITDNKADLLLVKRDITRRPWDTTRIN